LSVKPVTLSIVLATALAVGLAAAWFLNLAPPPAAPGAPAAGAVAHFTPIDPPRPAPDAAFEDGDGRRLTLADFRGRVLLLNFWATWCGPCVVEMPSLDRLQARLGGADFTVVALSQDRGGAEVVGPFYRRLGLASLGVYLDPSNRVARALGVDGLPTTFVLDRQGRTVGTLEGPAEWDSPEAVALIERIMGKKSSVIGVQSSDISSERR